MGYQSWSLKDSIMCINIHQPLFFYLSSFVYLLYYHMNNQKIHEVLHLFSLVYQLYTKIANTQNQ